MSSTMRTVASTAAVAVGDRVAFWEDYNTQNLVALRCMLYHDRGLQAEQVNVDLDQVKLARITGNAHVIDRTEGHISATPKESMFLTHLVSGSAFFLHSQGSIRLAAGDTILYDPSKPYLFGFDTDMDKVLLEIPKSTLAGLDRLQSPVVRPRPDAAARHRGAALLSAIEAALSPSETTIPSASELVDAAVALFWPGEAAGVALCEAAKLALGSRLADLDLTVDEIARSIGVSSRHLNRLFVAIEGMTATQYVQQARLQAAYRDLSDPAFALVRVADIAARWGFSSQSHLTRAFGRQFGCSPSDVRGVCSA